ncbi:MAG: glycerophosphodiester phosphodiesterase [Proteobacteria bacterium]|nr:glycerophosphodiester phosphodiesterase [Pseudomonadota bacterium]
MTAWRTLDGKPSRIIAHRGASGQRPEHSRAAYELAFAQGADAVEPDVLPSRDGVLFVRHDIDLAPTTDIAQRVEFAARNRVVDGKSQWWIGDFDAGELDTLCCVQPNAARSRGYDGQSTILRLSTLLPMARAASCVVDVELKDPDYFRTLGFDPVTLLEAELGAAGMRGADAPVWLECSDHAVLRDLHARCGNRCFALIEAMPAAGALRTLAPWASGVAPPKNLLWDPLGNDAGLVTSAHAAGLEVHAWTFRDDADCAPFATPRAELDAAFALGVDALFCDFPATALAARDAR